MKGSLTASILNYLESPKPTRLLRASKFSWLLLFVSTSVLIGSWAVVSIAAPQKVAQVNVVDSINRPTLKVGSQGERVSELQAALKLLGFYSGTVDGTYSEDTAKAVSRFKQAVGLSPDGVVDAATWQRLFPNQPTTATVSSANPTTNSASNLIPKFPVPTQSATTQVPTKPEPRPATRKPSTAQAPTKPATRKPPTTQVPTKPATRKPPTTQSTKKAPQRPSTTRRTSQIAGVQYTSEGWPILRLGMRNAEVTKLQRQLQKLGFLGGNVDGDFGPTTEAAVKAAQKRYGLEPDGVVGGATWEVLLRRSPQGR
ncbi:peptidoglycan-binding protein [Nostocaceae cyanobacterium CENA357]|uniref:Peptidoglycan-binding protein n=1 Tax=Atlanticothrix silvestris CENA357 TaxID=1725252 RepID=A0A8J7L700_9CYAN|nr:peptidoglycan-binding domain-containing protein [Atlanticothrix silvestris]MBH8556247.1 peptidoglycan-binding protein [Atlanticothrix silvestris CENA357]